MVVIKRQSSRIEEVDRRRVRPHQVPNMIPLHAVDPAKMPSRLKALAKESEPEAELIGGSE